MSLEVQIRKTCTVLAPTILNPYPANVENMVSS